MIRAGLFLYDHLATRRTLPASRKIDLRTHPAGQSLEPRYRTAFEYSDGWVDDARLVVANAVDAFERGAEVLTRTACVRLQRDGGEWIATLRAADGRERTLRARVVVNAAGPWVAEFLDHCTPTPARHHPRMIRGSHIVVRKLFDHEFAYIFQAPDGRIVFALPYEGDFTLIGTTESEYTGDLAHPAIAAAEQAYLLDMANRYFQRDLGVNDVVWTFAGLRPLLAASMDDPKSVTRDYVIDFDRSGPPLLSMYGGKLTTYRKLAEQVVDMLAPALGLASNAWTAATPLPGGDMPDADFEGFLAQVQCSLRLARTRTAAPLCTCVRHAHGPAARRMLEGHGSRRGSAARPVRAGGSLSARCGIRPHGAGHPLSPQQARRAPGRGQRENPGRVARAALTRASVRADRATAIQATLADALCRPPRNRK